MEEILENFKKEQSHFRKVICFSLFVVFILGVTSYFYLNNFKNIEPAQTTNTFDKESYFLVANLMSTTTDSVSFKILSDPTNTKYIAYLDDKTVNKLATSTKIGDAIRIYSRTSIDNDKDGFVISKIENYIK